MMLALAATTLMTACSKDESEIDNWNGEIRLSSGVTVQQTRATGTVPDTQIASGQTVQVVVSKQDADQSATTYGYDQALTAQGDGTFATPATAMYYPQSGKGVSIYAFHPSTAAASFTVADDQSKVDGTAYFKSDLLYSAKADYAKQSAAHSLSFDHKLSKLTYELKSGTGSPTVAGATVEWMNVLKSAPFDKTTGVVGTATGTAGTVKPHATHGAIIVPQTVNANKELLKVTLKDGGVLYYKPSVAQDFVEKQKYHYTITVNLTGLSVESSVSDWLPVTNRTGDATL